MNMYISGDTITYVGSNPAVCGKLSAVGHLVSQIGLTTEYRIDPEHQEEVMSNEFQQTMQELGVTIKPWTDVLKKLEAFNRTYKAEIPIADLHLGGGLTSMLLTHF